MTEWSQLERGLSAADAEERRRAAASLALTTGPNTVALLVRALGDGDWRVRKEAVHAAIAHAPSAEVLGALVDLLRPGDNVGARNGAVEALAGYGVHALPALARALADLDADGRKLVVDVLAKSARAEALPILRTLVGDTDANVRGAAVEAVSAIGEGCAEEAIAILDAALDAPGRFERVAALHGLNRLSATLPWDRLEPLAADPLLLPAVLAAAGRSGAEPAVPLLIGALASSTGRSFVDALAALHGLCQANTAARERLRRELANAPAKLADEILGLAGDEEASVEARRHALAAAALLVDDRAARAAAEALSDDALAEQAEAALTELGSTAVPALVEGARGSSAEQRAACITLLGPLVALDPDANAAAKRALGDPAPEVVAAALDALAQAGDRATLADAAGLIDASPVVAQAAHRALVQLARRHQEAALVSVRATSPGSAAAEAAATVIEALGRDAGGEERWVEFLTQALNGPFPRVRRAALSALATVGGVAAEEPVAFALTDEEPEVRLAAVRALGRLKDERGAALGVEQLLELARASADLALVAAAARALGEVRDPRAVPVLADLLSREPRVAVAAVEALGAFEPALRREHLGVALRHPDPEVVKATLRVLASAREAGALEALGDCLDHPEWDVRRLAAELLGQLGGDRARELVLGRLSLEAHDLVRDELGRALIALETESGRRRTAPPPSLRGVRRG